MQNGRSETHVSSKSENQNVLSIYHQILEHGYSDSDYWYLIGGDYLLDILYDFNEADIQELKSDLPNWTLKELEIFREALTNDYSASHDDLLPIRSYLYGCIFTLLDNYLTVDQRAANILAWVDEEFLSGGYIKDEALLQEMKLRLENTESTLLCYPENYIRQSKIDSLKKTIEKLLEATD
jgi:hypothetical protein